MVIQAISNATTKTPSRIVDGRSAKRAVALARFVLQHKMALLTDPVKPALGPAKILTVDDLLADKEKVKKTLTQHSTITARSVTHARCVPGPSNKSSADSAKIYLASLAENGLGEMVSGTRNSVSLKRKRYYEMSESAQQLFNELEIDVAKYEESVQQERKKVKRT